ncbi:arginine--tRNA ligase, partial [Microbacteriaceae bacterium K1510]|nr:arginine--tRNA ligase [Microbacteriaceae bacterium K1510]
DITTEKVRDMLETPPNPAMGDIAFPCFQLAKALRKAPPMIASELADKISGAPLREAKAAGPYVNMFLDQEAVAGEVIQTVLTQKAAYGSRNVGESRKVPIDLSSPNIAKPFSMGHLRSTVIGNALANIMEKHGYQPVR